MNITKSLFTLCCLLICTNPTSADEQLFIFDATPASSYSPTWIPPYRSLKSVSADGSIIEMDDGAIWNIKSGYQKNVRQWLSTDYLVFYPCSFPSWNGFKFWVYNARLRAKAGCSLSLGPIQYGPCTNHVQQLDFYRGECFLEDGRGYQNLWKISFDDMNRFQRWHINDAIIIGSKNHPEQIPYSSIRYVLLNVQENEYVKAEILY